MRFSRNNSGFTLIEMLIIAPIVLLVIAGFIALMVNMVGDTLVARSSNQMTYETQSALDQIEQDTHLSTQFLTTSKTLPTPQGSDNNFAGTAAFTNDSSLVFGELATDKNPLNSDRQLIYYAKQPNDCGLDQAYNRPLISKVIYFVRDGSLWRRDVMPKYNLNSTVDDNTVCNQPWQRNTCKPGQTIAPCETSDSELMHNVKSFDVQYFSAPGDSTALDPSDAEDASTIKVTLAGQQAISGKNIQSTESLRVTKLNDINVELPPPNQPALNHAFPVPDKVNFNWSAVSNATSYKISYQINNGTWVNKALNSQITSYTIDSATRCQTVVFKVVAHNATGDSDAATDALSMPCWTDLALQNDWQPYPGSYMAGKFTKSATGIVFIDGLVKNGTVSNGTVIATLPEGFRPAGRLTFVVSGNNPDSANGHDDSIRVDVNTNGNVQIADTDLKSGGYLSLGGIAFLPSTSTYTWQQPSWLNGWTADPNTHFESTHFTHDSIGRVIIQGRGLSGNTSRATVIFDLNGDSWVPDYSLHLLGASNKDTDFWIQNNGNVEKRDNNTPYSLAPNAIYYPGSIPSGWSNLPLKNGWEKYGGNFPPLQIRQANDQVVTIRGLVKNTISSNSVVATIPSQYCVSKSRVIAVSSNDLFSRLDLRGNCDIFVRPTSSGWVAINLSYIIDP